MDCKSCGKEMDSFYPGGDRPVEKVCNTIGCINEGITEQIKRCIHNSDGKCEVEDNHREPIVEGMCEDCQCYQPGNARGDD